MPSPQQVNIGRRNAVTVTGEGPPLLLVHGFGCDQSMWNPIAPALRQGRQIISYDLTGMGNSDYQAYGQRHDQLDGHVDDLIQVLESINPGPVVAIGHSVSSMIAGLAAIKRPELFSGLVMISPSPHYLKDGDYDGGFSRTDIEGLLGAMRENYQGWAGQLASMVAGDQQDRSTEQALNQRFCRNDPEISAHFARVTFLGDNRPDLKRIRLPTLIIHCTRDAIAPLVVAQYVRDHIPDAELVEIDGAGHAPHMTHPTQTAEAIQSFLKRIQ